MALQDDFTSKTRLHQTFKPRPLNVSQPAQLFTQQAQKQPHDCDNSDRFQESSISQFRHHRRIDIDADHLHFGRSRIADSDVVHLRFR